MLGTCVERSLGYLGTLLVGVQGMCRSSTPCTQIKYNSTPNQTHQQLRTQVNTTNNTNIFSASVNQTHNTYTKSLQKSLSSLRHLIQTIDERAWRAAYGDPSPAPPAPQPSHWRDPWRQRTVAWLPAEDATWPPGTQPYERITARSRNKNHIWLEH